MVSSAIPGLVILGTIRKQSEQAMKNKPVSSTNPWHLYQLLPPDSCIACVPVLTSSDDEQCCHHHVLAMVFHGKNRKSNKDKYSEIYMKRQVNEPV